MKANNVLVQNPDVQSRAALVLLKRDLRKRVNYEDGYVGWLRFRWDFLNSILRKGYDLECHYCKKGPLLIDADNNHPMVATLDHFIPLAKGGGKFDEKNLVVCCYPCNQKKKDKILSKDFPKDFIFQQYPNQNSAKHNFVNSGKIADANYDLFPRKETVSFCDLDIGDSFSMSKSRNVVYLKTGSKHCSIRGNQQEFTWTATTQCYRVG